MIHSSLKSSKNWPVITAQKRRYTPVRSFASLLRLILTRLSTAEVYNRIKFVDYNLVSWFYFMGNDLAKELFFMYLDTKFRLEEAAPWERTWCLVWTATLQYRPDFFETVAVSVKRKKSITWYTKKGFCRFDFIFFGIVFAT